MSTEVISIRDRSGIEPLSENPKYKRAEKRLTIATLICLGVAAVFLLFQLYTFIFPGEGVSRLDLLFGHICIAICFVFVWGLCAALILMLGGAPVRMMEENFRSKMIAASREIVSELTANHARIDYEQEPGIYYTWTEEKMIRTDALQGSVIHFPASMVTGVEVSGREVSSETIGQIDTRTKEISTSFTRFVTSEPISQPDRFHLQAIGRGQSRSRTKGTTHATTTVTYHHTVDLYTAHEYIPHLPLVFKEDEQAAKSFYGRLRAILKIA